MHVDLTESTAIPQPTTTTRSSSTSNTLTKPSTTSAAATQTATPQDTVNSESRSNAIGGGVVGGLLGLAAILACVAYLYFRRRRRIRTSSVEAPETHSGLEAADNEEEKQILPALVVHPPVIVSKHMLITFSERMGSLFIKTQKHFPLGSTPILPLLVQKVPSIDALRLYQESEQ